MTYSLRSLALVIIVGSCTVSAQNMIRGRVLDKESGEPLVGMTIWLPAESEGTTSGENGSFVLALTGDPDPVVRVQGLGYVEREFRLGSLESTDGYIIITMEEKPIMVGETVVTASRREQSLGSVPVSMSAIGAEDLAGRIGVTLEEPLRYVSGVNIMDDQINIRGSSGYSRGVGSRVLLLFDGIPLLTGDTGEIIWEMIPVDRIDRVEIVKGAGSALYGSSALGGVVNVIPSRIESGTHGGVRISGGLYTRPSYTEWQWSSRMRSLSQGSILVSLGAESWGTMVSFSRWMDESHRRNDVTHRYAFFNRTHFSITDSWSAEITGHYVHRFGGNFFWWKSLRSPLLPPDEYASRQVFSDRGFVAMGISGLLSERTAAVFRVQYFGNVWSDKDADVVTTESRSKRVFGEAQVTIRIHSDHHVVAGASAYLDNVRSNIFGTHPGFGAAGFVQDEYEVFDNVTLSSGLRVDWQRVSGLASGSQIDPRVGLAYRVSDATSLRASVGSGFRYPSIGELYTSIATGFGGVNVVPNTSLKPERSTSFEIGAMYQYHRSGTVDIALFQSDYRDLIEAAVDAQQLIIRFDNVEQARIRGFEVSAEQAFWGRSVSLQAGYTYLDPLNVSTGQTLRFRPRHVAVLGLQGVNGPFTAALEYRFVSRLEEIDENLVTVAEIIDGRERTVIHTVNVRFSWTAAEVGLPIRAGIEVRNVTNHQYVELLGNLAPPRTFMIMLETSL